MYIPGAHRIDDPKIIAETLRAHPFMALVSCVDDEPLATHLPLLVESDQPLVLVGHMAKANSHWHQFEPGRRAMAILSGPHGYVSPGWYESRPNVPTWNYVSIHAYGEVEIISDSEAALDHLTRMIQTFDPNLAEVDFVGADREFHRSKLAGIVVFKLHVDRIDAKAKLNQNKSELDRIAIRDRYLASEILDEVSMGQMMKD